MPYGGVYMKKYGSNYNIVDFSLEDMLILSNPSSLESIFDKELIKILNRKNAYNLLKSYISSDEVAKPVDDFMKNEIINIFSIY